MMINQVPRRLSLELTTTFELVHNAKTDSNKWFELFSIGYFNRPIDDTESRSKLQAHSMDVIAVGRNDKSNSIIFITLSLQVTITRLLSDQTNQDSS